MQIINARRKNTQSMNALLVLDYYVWKIFIMRISPSWFKSKLLSLLSLLYVALFPLPHKFILHFFGGTGSPVKVDTRDVVLCNQRVLAYLRKTLDEHGDTGAEGNVNAAYGQMKIGPLEDAKREHVEAEDRRLRIFIGQHMVSNPNHRYSIGSLHLICQPEQDMVHIRLEAQYRFSGNNDRITRYLHQRLNARSEKGAAANFTIEGNTWTLSRSALMSSEVFPRHRKYIDYNILYI